MRVGILGAGQLGRMLALAGYPLGLEFRFLDPAPDACGGQVGPLLVASYDDTDALERFLSGLDVATYEFENVPSVSASVLERAVPTFPPAGALEVAQDRLAEKQFFEQLGIPTAPFIPIADPSDISAAAGFSFPALLKIRRLGYDGKGQIRVERFAELTDAWVRLGRVPCILEALISFQREVSLISVRGRNGQIVHYPPVQNVHRDGILRQSVVPVPGPDTARIQQQAEAAVSAAAKGLDYVGVLTLEFFDAGGQLLANEMAPRVHNSGHWTIEGAETSQFENHLRAILGWPLGSCALRGWAGLVNLIGRLPDRESLLSVPGAHLHLYGKEPRPGRKLGHITLRADDPEVFTRRLAEVEAIVAQADAG